MKEILDVIHKTIYQFFDVCEDDEEVPMSDKDKLLLEVNKAICNNLKTLEKKPCDDVVSRQAVIDCATLITSIPTEDWDIGDWVCLFRDRVSQLPSVQPKPKTGHWIKAKDGYMRCDQCGSRGSAIKARYCHHCGAYMKEGAE